MLRTFAIVISFLGLSACGGGGGGSSSVPPTENCTAGAACTMPTGWVQGVFPTSSSAAQKCASPRSGVDPVTHVAYRDVQGTTTDENNFLRSWTHELYLW
jgi:carboxyl-terminal processing protease